MEKVFLFLWRQYFARKVAGSIRFLIISWLLYSSDSNLSPLPTKIFDLCLVGSWQFLYGMCNELLELVLELSNLSLISRLFECSCVLGMRPTSFWPHSRVSQWLVWSGNAHFFFFTISSLRVFFVEPRGSSQSSQIVRQQHSGGQALLDSCGFAVSETSIGCMGRTRII